MARAPFQCLIVLYRLKIVDAGDPVPEYAVFHRTDWDIWQFVSGGGEDGETPHDAAKRELWEETGITDIPLFQLDTTCSISATIFSEERRAHWGKHCYVIPEYTFAAKVDAACDIHLSHEHTAFCWMEKAEAEGKLRFDSNRVAMWELAERIREHNI